MRKTYVRYIAIILPLLAADVVAEWLRRWIANPLYYVRVCSNHIDVDSFLVSFILNTCFVLSIAIILPLLAADVVAEWLRRWTANLLYYVRVCSNHIDVVSFLVSFILNTCFVLGEITQWYQFRK
jgi:IS4 transposase